MSLLESRCGSRCCEGVHVANAVHARYLVIVPRSDPALFEHLRRRFAGDAATVVLLDRRRAGPLAGPWPGPERRAAAHGRTLGRAFPGVVVARAVTTPASVHHAGEEATQMEFEGVDDRQRVDRWLEESQYLLGRLIPGFLEDRDRLKERLAGAEAECDRLRAEVAELRQELGRVQVELEHRRSEEAAAAELCAALIEQLGELQRPLHELQRRLHGPVMRDVPA